MVSAGDSTGALIHAVWEWLEQTPRAGADGVHLFADGTEPGLRVALQEREPNTVSIALGTWSITVELTGEEGPDDAYDILAAGLFGHARVVSHRRGGRIEFLARGGWVPYASWGRGQPWWNAETRVSRNEHCPPFPLETPVPLPRAPWSGLSRRGRADAAVEPAVLVPDGELDLHLYSPKEVAAVVRAYIDVCLDRGILGLRIVHGKGRGQLRRTVHALLERHPQVQSFRLGGSGEGSWGATVVDLRARVGEDSSEEA